MDTPTTPPIDLGAIQARADHSAALPDVTDERRRERVVSAPEPTAEHVRLAREALPVNATPGQVNRIARALAAAEARGFGRGRAAEREDIATAANERGEGDPPVEGFRFFGNFGRLTWEYEDTTTGHVRACRVAKKNGAWCYSWTIYGDASESPWPTGTEPDARACMKSAWIALEAFMAAEYQPKEPR